ncbi:lysylphosphatidylglycerol synthase transmembrane domain-containing protein [Amycolatopsis sp. CA-128772]|uniref:lysylphosphatidylglycerol synthase transmembrane domain-containing protein n=1 Tax=Amycolatopsis sp. CA-128772 TaxID=2073159 RepID=UPI000CD16553|nr:lysylphosphatidylglycerol synthase transmembrane domain-containing protein [Amycolatopsis sp. CA-128772]
MTTVEDLPAAGKQPKSTRAKILDVVRWVAIALVIGFAAKQLAANWGEFWHTLRDVAWQSSLLSLLALVAAILVSTWGWQMMVDDLGEPIGYARGAQICLVGSLGKYVPGSVWAYLLQMELGRKAGLARARIFTGSLIQLGVGVVSALVVSLLAAPAVFSNSPRALWLFVLIPLGLAMLHPKILTWGTSLVLRILRRPPLAHPLGWAVIGKVFAASTAAWCLQGVHLWLLANSVGTPGLGGFVLCVGAMAVAMTVGTFAFILPSGVGVREVAQVAVLTASGLTVGQATAFAVASRVMFTVADLLTAGLAAVAARSARPAVPAS